MATASGEPGRRERKKAATRSAISSTALRLFLEHGYDTVGLRQIAAEADVAVATVFTHFSGKEALVFDEDFDIEASLLSAVAQRPSGQGILDALERWVLGTHTLATQKDPEFAAFRELVARTPTLDVYRRQMWLRHTEALAAAIQDAAREQQWRLPNVTARTVARVVLDTPTIVAHEPQPQAAVAEIFGFLGSGWPH